MGNRRVEFKFDERSMVDPDDLTDDQLDDFLRQFGYDPEQVKLRGKAFVEVALANMRLRADLSATRERIAALEREREWEPTPVGEIFRLPSEEPDTGFHAVRGRVYYTFETADGQRVVIALPDNYRVFRRRLQPQDGQNPTE